MQAILSKIRRDSTRGFTVVELVVVMVVTGILIGLVFTSLASYYQATVNSSAKTVNSTDNRVSLRTIQDGTTNITSFMSTSTLSAQTPLGTGNSATAWTYNGANTDERVLITRSNATDRSTKDVDRMVVFKPTSGNCDVAAATPIQVDTIYYVAADPFTSGQRNLYRRVIVESTPACPHPVTGASSSPYQKTTCRAGTVNPLCAGNDGLILRNVKSFNVDYFVNPNDQIPIPNIYLTPNNPLTQAAVNNATTIQVNVTTENIVEGRNEQVKSNIRISRTN